MGLSVCRIDASCPAMLRSKMLWTPAMCCYRAQQTQDLASGFREAMGMSGLKDTQKDHSVSWITYPVVLQSFCSNLIESDKLWETELMATAYAQYLKARGFFFFTEEQNQEDRKQRRRFS